MTSATSWIWLDGATINPTDYCHLTVQALLYRAVEVWQFEKVSEHLEEPEFERGILFGRGAV